MDRYLNEASEERSMISVNNGIISGGTYTQNITQNLEQGVLSSNFLATQVSTPVTLAGFEFLQNAIAPGAFHNSNERFNPPKCHQHTRTAVIKRIRDWILAKDPHTRDALIMWLYGAAGAGKSAIAQTVAEICDADGSLVGSFFFGRSDPNRNHAQSLVPTIAYQMSLVFPKFQESLFKIVEKDPTIFTRSLPTQFSSLIIQPLQECGNLHADGNFYPRLIIIDGLDECLDRDAQCHILDIILCGIHDHNLPLKFLIASRPEHDIKSRFNSTSIDNILSRLALDEDYQSYQDIERFFRNKFQEILETHPFKQYVPTGWPEDHTIKRLVDRSSGQFIFASTVINYVGSSRRLPHHQLEVIMQIRSAAGDVPFAELDALYRHFFSALDDTDLQRVLLIISFHFICLEESGYPPNSYAIGDIFSLEPAELEAQFCDLTSIIKISDGRLYVLHASLAEFLFDRSRSDMCHINLEHNRVNLVQRCIRYMTCAGSSHDLPLTSPHLQAMEFLSDNLKKVLHSMDLYYDIFSFPIAPIFQKLFSASGASLGESTPFHYFRYQYLPTFLEALKEMGELTESLYKHHLRSLDVVLSQGIKVYYSDVRLTLFLIVVDFTVTTERHGNFRGYDLMFTDELQPFRDIDASHLSILDLRYVYANTYGPPLAYYRLLQRYLLDPARSGSQLLDGDKYAAAALWILRFHSRKPRLVDFASAFLEFFRFVIYRASRSEELLMCCRQAQISANDFLSQPALRQAIRIYLEWMEGGQFE